MAVRHMAWPKVKMESTSHASITTPRTAALQSGTPAVVNLGAVPTSPIEQVDSAVASSAAGLRHEPAGSDRNRIPEYA